MPAFSWRPFLERFSREVLSDDRARSRLSADVVQSGWLGYPAATAKDIAALEKRLRAELPKSYREFLQATNGWRVSGSFIGELRSTSKTIWFREENQAWIDAYLEPNEGQPTLSLKQHLVYGDEQDSSCFRVEFLRSCLQISDRGDSAVYLLNPEVKSRTGEWEAWFFANWKPGAERYRTFPELMEAMLERFIRLRDKRKEGS